MPHPIPVSFAPKLVAVLREEYGFGTLRADAAAGLTVAIVPLLVWHRMAGSATAEMRPPLFRFGSDVGSVRMVAEGRLAAAP